jgi:hypothetical protein
VAHVTAALYVNLTGSSGHHDYRPSRVRWCYIQDSLVLMRADWEIQHFLGSGGTSWCRKAGH